jgi:histidinol-phosphatase (PHP family)
MADYVRLVEQAQAAGVPVLLGIELDWIPGREDDLRRLLQPYDWDIVLGSVHWIGAWSFDSLSEGVFYREWGKRDVDGVFGQYAALLRDLASSRLADVLAHPDLPKLAGHRPKSFTPLHSAIVESAKDGGCAIELNANGCNRARGNCPALARWNKRAAGTLTRVRRPQARARRAAL